MNGTPLTPEKIEEFYGAMELRKELSFSELSPSKSNWGTHSYHSYPAKFAPPLVKYLVENYTRSKEIIWDPFCGSGTVNVEALRNNRNSIGTDINPTAILISRTKTTPLNPKKLKKYGASLLNKIEKPGHGDAKYFTRQGILNGNLPELRRWYEEDALMDLAKILLATKKVAAPEPYKQFALCCFSSILKKTSYWLKTSVKSQFDYSQTPAKPIRSFENSFCRMEKMNEDFYNESKNKKTFAKLYRHDATKEMKKFRNKIDHIVTSPPYLVSYEYGDIFRLSTYLLTGYEGPNYLKFKRQFIGTRLEKEVKKEDSTRKIFNEAAGIGSGESEGKAKSALNYYQEMANFFQNAKLHLRKKGKLTLVVGDAVINGQKVPNAYILSKIAETKGFAIEEKFKREIGRKNLPSFRDKTTGKFVHKRDPNGVLAHPEEYILAFKVA
ncbi:MAG: DNA methyltransferase [Candidatus Diapherotrites archaeon]